MTLQVEQQVIDFAGWKAMFDSYAGARDEAGVRSVKISRQLDEPDYVVVDLEFDNADMASSYLEFLRRNVWVSDAFMRVADTSPDARILHTIYNSEKASVAPQWGLSA